MTGRIEARIAELGLILPPPGAPAGSYVPTAIAGTLVFVSGQLPIENGKVAYAGRLGADISPEQGYEAAKLCALMILSQIKAAIGDLDRVARIIRLGGFVCCTPDFTQQPDVVNGASDLMVAIFGESGRHARAAVGAPSLPRGACVEVDAVVELHA
jgi:enamine deaminase RidA (YjgF/YER057c/UK114 family)